MNLSRPLIKGEKITVFGISDWMATTMRAVWIVTGERGGRYTGKQPGKKKEFYLNVEEKIVLPGESTIKADTDFNLFSGNACFNLVASTKEELSSALATSLTPIEALKDKIYFIPLDKIAGGAGYEAEELFEQIAD